MKEKKGFTLIEILIVVAIIAVLASVVLVGLGPTQQAGRDSRRLADLREVQNALELFYSKCGFYPGTISSGACATGDPAGNWTDFRTAIIGTGLVNSMPADPSSNRTYAYGETTGNVNYVLAAALENANNSVMTGYMAPSISVSKWIEDSTAIVPNTDCKSAPVSGSGATYCISL